MRSLITIVACLPLLAHAQSLVSTAPMPRTALLEEFTAINCGNCPGGHAVAASLESQHGTDLTVIGIHGGSLATPSSGQPDFRTTAGSALWTQFSIFSQPKGMVGRGGVINTGAWGSAVQNVLAQTSPVNIGVASTFDPQNQTITVQVELFYTGPGPLTDDRIFVALTEDHITGYQQDYVNGSQQNYDHRHVLRDYFTTVTGDLVSMTAVGTFVQRTYNLTVDPAWNMANSYVVAFVGEENGEVHQVREVAANGGSTTDINDLVIASPIGNAYPQPAVDEVSFPMDKLTKSSEFQLSDATGRVVRTQFVAAGNSLVRMSVEDLPEGIYFAAFIGGQARKVVIAR